MPLRLFLGWLLFFAGVLKLASPQYFKTTSPSSIHAELVRATHSSPIHALIGQLVPIASGVGLVDRVSEIAIGVCVLVGLWMARGRCGRPCPLLRALLDRELPLVALLPRLRHPVPSCLDTVGCCWGGGSAEIDTWLVQQQQADERQTAAVRQDTLPRRALLSKGAVTGIAAAVVPGSGGVASLIGSLDGRHLVGQWSARPSLCWRLWRFWWERRFELCPRIQRGWHTVPIRLGLPIYGCHSGRHR